MTTKSALLTAILTIYGGSNLIFKTSNEHSLWVNQMRLAQLKLLKVNWGLTKIVLKRSN